MYDYNSIDRRIVHALTELLTVLAYNEVPVVNAETMIVTVMSASGLTYEIDVRAGVAHDEVKLEASR